MNDLDSHLDSQLTPPIASKEPDMPTSGPHRDQPLLLQAPSYVRDVDQAHAVLTARVADDERVNDPSWPRVVLVFDEAQLLTVRVEPQTRVQALTQLKLAEIARKGRYVGLTTLPDLTRDGAITSPGARTFDMLRRTRPGQEQAAPARLHRAGAGPMSAITAAPAGQVWAWSATSNAAVLIDDVAARDELEDLDDDLVGDDRDDELDEREPYDLDDDPGAGAAGARVACTACRAATSGGHTPDQARARAAAHDQVHHQGRPTARIHWAPATSSSSSAAPVERENRDARLLALLAAAGIRVVHHQVDVGLDFDPGPIEPGYAYDPGRRVPEQDCLGVWLATAADVAALTAAAGDLAVEWVHVAPSAVLRATRPDGHPRGCLHGVAIPRRHHDQLLHVLTRHLQGVDVDQELDDVDDGTGPDDVLRAADGLLLTVADLQAYLHQMPPSAPVLLAAGAHGTGGRAPLQVAWPALYAADGAPLRLQDPADVQFAVVLAPA